MLVLTAFPCHGFWAASAHCTPRENSGFCEFRGAQNVFLIRRTELPWERTSQTGPGEIRRLACCACVPRAHKDGHSLFKTTCSSFHFLFHYPHIAPIYCSTACGRSLNRSSENGLETVSASASNKKPSEQPAPAARACGSFSKRGALGTPKGIEGL